MQFSLDQYNEAQRQAITHRQGPFLLISGAGTGKTHVLTGRILHLLLTRNVSASEILALTFTEKATQEMIERIDAALPLGHEEVCIKTFHGFCETVLRERGHEIGISPDYILLNEVDSWLFLKKKFTELPLNYYRPLGNPHKFLRVLQDYFNRLQDEDITPDFYDAYIKKMNRTKNPSEEEKEIEEKHTELAAAYTTYLELLLKNNVLDFGSLVFFTLRLFEKRASVLAQYQKQFRFILVDEFQDTNFAQNKLITLVAAHHKNLFVVGDDDQAIYKWRGASLSNIQYFKKLFPKTKTLVLNENYRSNQAVLDFAYHSIQKNNPNRLEITEAVDKRLRAVSSRKNSIPVIYHCTNLSEEIALIMTKAKAAHSAGKNVAIVVRTNALIKPFLAEFQKRLIPFQYFSGESLFQKPAVKDCMAVLRVIGDPTDDLALFRLLRMPFWNISMETLLGLLRSAKSANRPLFGVLIQTAESQKVKALLDILIAFSRDHTVSLVMGKFLEESGYFSGAKKNSGEDAEGAEDTMLNTASDLALFSEKITAFEETHEEKSVTDFLSFAALWEEVGAVKQEQQALDPNAIKIMTIHGAKGLEFDVVFIAGLVQGKFPTVNRKEPFEIPKSMITETIPEGDHHMEEERRLFYVAATRARESLIMTYSDFYEGKKKWKPSLFVLETLQSGKVQHFSPKNSGKYKKENPEQTLLPFDKRQHQPISLKIPNLSFSQLDTFQDCPLKYQFRYIFSIHTPLPFQVNFGTSVHNTLRDFYSELQKKIALEKINLVLLNSLYEKNWISAGFENRTLEEDQKKRGRELLQKFYEKEKNALHAPAFIEKSFTLDLGKIKIAGRIDRIDQLPDGTYEVIDYKTGGNHEKDLKKNLQLSLYALACRDALKIPVSQLTLYFLDGLERVSTTRTNEEIDSCREEIIKYAEEMAQSDFSPTPGFHCSYCDYRLICPAAMVVSR